MMYILLGVGVVVLLSCCCCGGGGGGWWYVSSQATPAFVGNWENKEQKLTLIIIANGKGVYDDGKISDFKWKTIDSNKVEFDLEDTAKQKTFWIGNSRPTFTYKVEGDTLTLADERKISRTFKKVLDKK